MPFFSPSHSCFFLSFFISPPSRPPCYRPCLHVYIHAPNIHARQCYDKSRHHGSFSRELTALNAVTRRSKEPRKPVNLLINGVRKKSFYINYYQIRMKLLLAASLLNLTQEHFLRHSIFLLFFFFSSSNDLLDPSIACPTCKKYTPRLLWDYKLISIFFA
jgi:hypothetical protein